MSRYLSEKILYTVTILLIITTLLLSLSFPAKNSIYPFLLVFILIYWQRRRLQSFFQKIQNPKISYALYILTGWLWAIFLEFNLGPSPFHPKPIANYLVGIGFYLPYFAVWLALIKRCQFTIFEVFYLSGFGRLIFDLLITRRLLISVAVTTNVLSAFLIFSVQAVVSLTLFGVLTTLPALYLTTQENNHHNKPLKGYLLGLTPGFLAAGVFIVWTAVLKIVFT